MNRQDMMGGLADLSGYDLEAQFPPTSMPDFITQRIAQTPRDFISSRGQDVAQSTRELLREYERSPWGLLQAQGYRQAPQDFYRKQDAAAAERAVAPSDVNMNPFAATPQEQPTIDREAGSVPDAAIEALRWHGLSDAATGLAAGSTVARYVPHPLARAAVIAAPMLMGGLVEPAEAANIIKPKGGFLGDILGMGGKPQGTTSNWILRYDPTTGTPNLVNTTTGNAHVFSGLATGMPPDKMTYGLSGTPNTSLPVYDPAAYFAELQRQKAELIFGVSDRMAGGGELVQAGKTKFRNPIPQEAGINYPLIHEGKEIPGIPSDLTPLFASVSKNAAGKMINPAREVLESGGVPYFAAVNMTHMAGDSTKQMANTVYRALKQSRPDETAIGKIDEAAKKQINAIGEPPTPYPGFASKELPQWLDDAGLVYRNAFVKAADASPVQKATNVDVGLLRYANTDPRLRSTPSGSAGLLIGKMRPEAGYSDFPLHSNYPFSIWGERGQIGNLPGSIPFSLISPEMHRAMLPITNQGVSLANAPHSSVMRGIPGGLTRQPVNDEVVNNVGEWFRQHPQGWSIAAGAPLGAGMMGGTADQGNYNY